MSSIYSEGRKVRAVSFIPTDHCLFMSVRINVDGQYVVICIHVFLVWFSPFLDISCSQRKWSRYRQMRTPLFHHSRAPAILSISDTKNRKPIKVTLVLKLDIKLLSKAHFLCSLTKLVFTPSSVK